MIGVDAIDPSPTNPRKRFDKDKLNDLAESIKAKGVLQPLLVRPSPAKSKSLRFELVAGERRFRAAKLADLKEVPATVRELSDLDVIECQVIENDQREDVLPSERAAGYQALIDAGRTVEQVAEKVGKSASWVRSVLKIGNLSKKFLAEVDDGQIPRSTAELVARVPDPASRGKVELCVLNHCYDPQHVSTKTRKSDDGENAEPLSYRDTKSLIGRYFQIELKGSPFGQADAELVKAAGPCSTCPKRAGNAGDEFAGIRADMCLDPSCHASKMDAFREKEIAAAKEGGRKVLSQAEAKKAFNQYGETLACDAPFIDLAERCWEDKKQRTYSEVLRKANDHIEVTVAYHPKTNKRFELADKATVAKALKAAGIKRESSGGGFTAPKLTPAQKAARAKDEEDRNVRKRLGAILIGQVGTGVEKLFKTLPKNPRITQVLRTITLQHLEDAFGGDMRDIARQWCEVPEDEDPVAILQDKVPSLGTPELAGILAQLTIACTFNNEATHKEFAEALKLDLKAFEKQARKELAAAAEPTGYRTPASKRIAETAGGKKKVPA